MPMHPPLRTRVRVIRTDLSGAVREFPSMLFAYRQLIGTSEALGYSEHQRIRAILRRGEPFRDARGHVWQATGGVVAPSTMSAAVAATIEPTVRWDDFTFGVELEIVAPIKSYSMAHKLSVAGFSTWQVKHDGSLRSSPEFNCPNCMEIISPILRGEDGIAKLHGVLTLIKDLGSRVNISCGMHVHVGVRGLQPTQVRKIAIAFLNNEHNFDALVATSRRSGNQYCKSNRIVAERSLASLPTARTIQALGSVMNGGNASQHYNSYRYYKLNFQSFVHHGTIEFRQHAGTVESAKACAWVRLITGFCANAVSQAQQQINAVQSFEDFVTGSTDEAGAAYLNGRRAALSLSARRAA